MRDERLQRMPQSGVFRSRRAAESLGLDDRLAERRPGLRLMILCTGRNNLRDIAAILSKEYDAPADQIEADISALLQPLVNSGYIQV